VYVCVCVCVRRAPASRVHFFRLTGLVRDHRPSRGRVNGHIDRLSSSSRKATENDVVQMKGLLAGHKLLNR